MQAIRKKKPTKKKAARKAVAAKPAKRKPDKPIAVTGPHVAPVLLAVAASSTAVKLSAAGKASTASTKLLLGLPLKDARVGVATKAGVEAVKAHLALMMPVHAAALLELPAKPSSTLADLVHFVDRATALAAPEVVMAGPLAASRRMVTNTYGKELAQKCSDRLLRYLGAVRRESVAGASPALLLEAEAPKLRSREGIEEARQWFYGQISPLRAAMEKKAGRRAVEVCWLNGTMRVSGGVSIVAEIAGDAGLLRVDLPRRLVREMNVCAATLQAIEFRNRTGLRGNGIRIAVIDGEVQVDHPQLSPRVIHQAEFVAEGFGNPDAHGTMVAGIAAGDHEHVAGIAPEATVLNYKVFPTLGTAPSADEFEGAQAIAAALQDRAHVVNCSWGAGPVTAGRSRLELACDQAWAGGLVVVKSAGNEGLNGGEMTKPADTDGVIVVAATDRGGTRIAPYSSRGPSPTGKRPHLSAPGGEDEGENSIRSLLIGGEAGRTGFGTSCAAPMVSGIVALLLEGRPGMTPDEVREQLMAMCTPLAEFSANEQGAGLLRLELPT